MRTKDDKITVNDKLRMFRYSDSASRFQTMQKSLLSF